MRLLLAAALLAATTARADDPPAYATLPATVREASGLVASLRTPGLYWTHNDSGGGPRLFAIGADGRPRGTLLVAGVENRDWEDLASFELDGRAWLLIADTGDNAGRRGDCALHIVPEPAADELSPDGDTVARVAWSLPVRYLDGPRDVESVAVDAKEGFVWLLAKRTDPHGLYRLPLRTEPGARTPPAALPVAQVPGGFFPTASAAEALLPTPRGRHRAQPTGMDFSRDGSAAAVLTYGEVLIFRRGANEDWPAVLSRPPAAALPHSLAQAEGVAFTPEGDAVLVVGEGVGTPIVRLRISSPE